MRQRIFLFHVGIEKLCPCAVVRFAAILTLLTATLPAFAALGEAANSVQVDQAHMRGVSRVTQTQAYTVHEIQAATGTVVWESVSSSGKDNAAAFVFGELAGPNSLAGFDWGLPFFFGRNVFTAIEGKSTPGGTGPYWAY